MSAETAGVRRTTSIAMQLSLLPLLAVILFGLFGFILPPNRWTVWTIPGLIAAGGVVLILVAWPFREPVRAAMLDALAATLALASAIPGLAVTMLIAYGVALQIAENRYGTQSLLYQLTSPIVLRQTLKFALVPIVPGLIGLWLAKRRATARTSRAAVAARFSLLSLVLSGLIACAIVMGTAYHRLEWP
jgi:nitrate reductase NapE component